MPVRDRRPEDEQPLFRAVNEQRLMRPVSGEQQEAAQTGEEQTAPPTEEASQGTKGPIARAMDKAQENNWVYDSVAEKSREKGLVDKADGLLNKVRNKLTGE